MLKPILILVLLTITITNAIDINQLLNSMTVEEKCGQMTQITYDVIEKKPQPADPDETPVDLDRLRVALKEKHVGSILNAPYNLAQKVTTWHKIISLIQDVALNETRLKIPVIYGIDSIHGANYIQEATLFPHSLSMSGSFNPEIAKKAAEITALETRATGIPWNFNPVLDVGRQPLWPRLFETYGEDPYLASKMGEVYIHGSQGDSIKNRTKVATCLKHYIGYSFPFNGRDRTPAIIPENLLREVFLPPFEHGVLAGSPTVMVNSGEVNGIPGHANYHYLTEILKGELKFSGFVVSDWEDIVRLYTRDKLAESPEEAVRIAVMAGLDMSMVPFDYSFFDHCVNLAKKDSKFMDRVNDATRRILKVKDDLGLFESSYPVASDANKVSTDESHQFNLEAARESIVLAKNENKMLPLNQNDAKKILIAGQTGNALRVLNGGWSFVWQGNVEEHFKNFGKRPRKTIYEAIKALYPNTDYSEGANFTHVTNIDETINKAKNSDLIILTIGEDSYCETPGNINNLILSESQQILADRLFELNKPVVLVYIGGRPRIITNIVHRSKAVLIGFLPGDRGSEAIADILFGKYNPDSRLSVTYPVDPNGIMTYDHKPLEVFDVNYAFNLFPFGHGLSYTTFEYTNLKLSKTSISNPESFTVTVNVKNTGDMDGKDSVLLFLNDEVGSVTRPVRQLKGFKKVFLKKGEATDVTFDVKFMDLSFISSDYNRIVEAGKFNVYVGSLNATFNVIKGSDIPSGSTSKPVTTPKNSALLNSFNREFLILGVLTCLLKKFF